jgi:subtilisin family serine protease
MFVSISALPAAPAWTLINDSGIPGYSGDTESFFQGTSSGNPVPDLTDPLVNIHSNLHDWLAKGIAPSYLRVSEDYGVSVLLGVTPDVDWDDISSNMEINNVFNLGIGYMVQGFIRSPKALFRIDAAEHTGVIMGDQRIDYHEAVGPEVPVTDQYYVQEIIGNDIQMNEYGYEGTDQVIGIVDTGVDFGHPDLAGAYHTNSSGYGTSFDPGGTGIAITSWTGCAVTGYLPTTGFDFQMWYGEIGATRWSNTTYDILADDINVGLGGESLSGFYKVGMARLPSQFFLFMLVDENTPLVYDTLYIDWETSWYLTADYNGWDDQGYTADWDFTDNLAEPHRWGDGTEVLAFDLDGDGLNDFSMGALANTFDLFGQVNGDVLSGIDHLGRGFAHMFDTAGHGTSCAGSAAGRGTTGFDVYGDGALYTVPGTAPDAYIMALKLFTFGDYINCWFWGSGYRPMFALFNPYSLWFEWDHCMYFGYDITNQAQVLSNSWGMIGTFFGGAYNFVWGADWYSYTIDFLTTGGIPVPGYYSASLVATGYSYMRGGDEPTVMPAPLFVVSMGNAGPGYGTSGAPNAYTALMVGASTTAHYAQMAYNNDSSLGSQPVDQIADFSSCGPTPQGLSKPDVVAPGAYAFDIAPLVDGMGNANDSWTVFGGTSQAAPLTAGVVALACEAAGLVGAATGWLKACVEGGADDINQPAFRQGAGRINASKTVAIAYGHDDVGNDGTDYLPYTMFDWSWDNFHNTHEPADFSRAWYMNMYFGFAPGTPFFYDSYYHPSYFVPWDDDGFTYYGKPGESADILGGAGSSYYSLSGMDAERYELENISSGSFTSTSVYTTFPLFGEGWGIDNFDDAFQAQFMAADYAIIYLAYSKAEFESLYDLATQANYVFLHDWNDTNEDGIIQLQENPSGGDPGHVGEVRRVMYDYSDTNVHQIHVGNPGAQWMGDQNATIYYHDVGNELYLWQSLDVTVTIKLFNRVDWDWFSFDQYGYFNWNVTCTIPGDAEPGLYSGFLKTWLTDDYHYTPIAVRVDGECNEDSGPLTFGNLDGHPYDNGAIDGALSWSNRYASGEWRFYAIDVTDEVDSGYNFTSWVMTNVTWMDPETCIDVYILMGGYHNNAYLGGTVISDTEYLGGGRWDGTPTTPTSNILLTDFTWDIGASCSDRGYFWVMLHVSEYGGNYIQENFTVTITCVNNMTLPGFESIPGSTAEIRATSHGNALVTPDSVWNGTAGHVMFEATWDPLIVPGFPAIGIQSTAIELLSTVRQLNNGTITGPVQGGWTPDVNPREGYDYVNLLAGQNVYISIEFGTWTAGEGSALIHGGADDIDVFVWAPEMAHTYANSLTGPTTCTGANPEVGTFVAPVSGEYTIGLDYYSGVVPMGWQVYVYAYQAVGVETAGLSSEMDTAITDTNAAYDVRARMITGTTLDLDDAFSSYSVSNVYVQNFHQPIVEVTSPGDAADQTVGPGLVNINWTGTDINGDLLGYSVEVSNDSGATWKVIVYGTTQTSTVWDPQSAFYGMPPTPMNADGTYTPNFLVRVNVTDGRYTDSDVCDNLFILAAEVVIPTPPLELFVVIIVIVIVIIILLATCLLKRRQSK